jgi:acyl-coenzyme A synthetase/AMP-(fatty) acid ligase
MNALSDTLPKIDFDYYRKMVADPSLVDKLKKEVRKKTLSFNRFDEYLFLSMKMPKSPIQKIQRIVLKNLKNMQRVR